MKSPYLEYDIAFDNSQAKQTLLLIYKQDFCISIISLGKVLLIVIDFL